MSYVYFAKVSGTNGPIKIGCSTGPKCRLRQLEIDLRLSIDLIGKVHGTFADERNVHLKFDAMRVEPDFIPNDRHYAIGGKTEWFEATPEILAFIDRALVTGKLPLKDSECRDRMMLKLRKKGETFAAIGRQFGVTRQRAQQIVALTERRLLNSRASA